jgi:hypothetical protein
MADINDLQQIPPWMIPRMMPYPQGVQNPMAQPAQPQGPQLPPWLQKVGQFSNNVLNRLGGPTDPNLDPREQAFTQQRQRMAMIQALLQSSTPRPQGTSSVLGDLGTVVGAGQQAGAATAEDLMKAKLMRAQMKNAMNPRLVGVADPKDFTVESLAKYQQTGNLADLVRTEGNIFGKFNPRDYTPESVAKFAQSHDANDLVRVAPFQFQTDPGGGIRALDPISGQQAGVPLSPTAGTALAGEKARTVASNTATGEAIGKAQGAILTKAVNAGNINSILDIAEPLIDEATGSGTGAIRDKLAAFFGESTTGAQATAQLLPLQAALMLNQPRMEGPQSDRDVQLYREAAGQIGDPTVPRDTKKAAMKTIRRLQDQYTQNAKGANSPSGSDDARIQAARDAIAKGAPVDKVKERLGALADKL